MSDETKHTAGPWTWYGDELLSPSEFVMGASKGNWPKDNDARLIAAAPEMYAALKMAEGSRAVDDPTFDAIRSAIAKAEGRSK